MRFMMRLMLTTLSIAALCAGSALAGNVTIPHNFQAGTPAVADNVDENFEAVRVEVNDNNTRISTNASNITTNTTNISTNASAVTTNRNSISSNAANIIDITTELDSMPGIAFVQQSGSAALTSSYANIMSVTINAPSTGFVFVTATGMIQVSGKTNNGANEYSSVYVGMSDVSNTSPDSRTRFYISGIGPSGSYEIPYSVQNAYPVNAGSNTFYLVGIENGGSGSGAIYFSQMTAIFIRNNL